MSNTATLALPDFVIGIHDPWGLGEYELMYTLEERTDGAGEVTEIEGVVFGAWSAEPPEIELAFGTWSGPLTQLDVALEVWNAL